MGKEKILKEKTSESGMHLPGFATSVPYFAKLITPYLRYGKSYISFFRYVSKLKRHGKQFGKVRGTNAVFQFDVRDLVIPSYIYTRNKTYSQEDMELFFRFVSEKCGEKRNKGYFLDIGANIGTTTVHVAKNIAPDLQVLAFEPDELNFKLLSRNCELNGCKNVRLCNFALSDCSGVRALQVFDYNRGKCKILPDSEAEECKVSAADENLNTENVTVCKLDDYLREQGISGDEICYIWIDVEGHESSVIDGMMELLTGYHPPILMEFTPKGVPCMEVDSEDFVRMYRNLCQVYKNMIIWPLNDTGHIREFPITHLESLFHEGHQQYNLFLY